MKKFTLDSTAMPLHACCFLGDTFLLSYPVENTPEIACPSSLWIPYGVIIPICIAMHEWGPGCKTQRGKGKQNKTIPTQMHAHAGGTAVRETNRILPFTEWYHRDGIINEMVAYFVCSVLIRLWGGGGKQARSFEGSWMVVWSHGRQSWKMSL